VAELNRSSQLGMSVGRLEAFSDGVLAIVITLLILDVKVPEAATGELGRALADQWPQYAAYLSSFLIVGIIWLNHHAVVQLLSRADHGVQVHNLLLLLPVSVLPWPTAVLAEYLRDGTTSDQRVAVLLYGITSSLMAVAFNLMWRYILRHDDLRRPEATRASLAVRNRRFNVGLLSYPVATLVGLVSVPLFLVLMFCLAVLYLLPTPEVRAAQPQ
jgi:uncharacterized membrane protein